MIRAGAAELDITPPLGLNMPGLFHERLAETVHDPLAVRTLVVESGGSCLCFSVCDLIGIHRDIIDRARARVAETLEIPPHGVMISCTHTHAGTEASTWSDYTTWLVDRIVDSIRIAWQRREPALAGWGSVDEHRLPFNRRFRMEDGTVRTNPGYANPDVVEAVGPVDPELGVLCLKRPAGGVLGVLANYSMHYIGGGGREKHAISADYFGMFANHLPRLCEADFVAAFSVGASGDINNIDVLGGSRPPNDHYQHTDRAGALLAADAYWAMAEMEFHDDAAVGSAMEEVVLERKRVTEEDVRVAEAWSRLENATMAQRVFAWQTQRRRQEPPRCSTWVQALRIGSLAYACVPGRTPGGSGPGYQAAVPLPVDHRHRTRERQRRLPALPQGVRGRRLRADRQSLRSRDRGADCGRGPAPARTAARVASNLHAKRACEGTPQARSISAGIDCYPMVASTSPAATC